jgi:putative restriction endonuclease
LGVTTRVGLYVSIFCFLKKKAKGFPLQSLTQKNNNMATVRRNWTREELIVAFNLYCKIPFSKINYNHPLIKKLAEAIQRTPSAVAWKLVNFASLDPSLKERDIKGASNVGKLDKIIFDEFYHDWNTLAYESEVLLADFLNQDLEKIIIEDYENYEIKEGKVRESLVKVRVNQSFFRSAVLASYDNKCCITGISINEFLIASHIIPWSKDEKNRLNPENGLCLNSIHDKAFDKGFLTIDFDYKIKISKYFDEFKKENNIQKFFLDFENKEIQMPKRFLPNKDFLEYHHQNIFKK